MVNRAKNITDETLKYIEENFCKDAPKGRSDAGIRSDVQVSAIEGKFIKVILSMIRAKNVIEIGSMHGYSGAWILSAIPDDGELLSIEKSRDAYDIAIKNIGGDPRVKLINSDAKDVLIGLNDASYDFIFIDANKSAYTFYLDQAARLLKEGGVMLADDALLFSEVWLNCNRDELSSMEKGVLEFNESLSKSRYFLGLTIPMLHGAAIAVRTSVNYVRNKNCTCLSVV